MLKLDLENFSKYIKGKDFLETVHKARKESMERIIGNEPFLEIKPKNSSSNKDKDREEKGYVLH